MDKHKLGFRDRDHAVDAVDAGRAASPPRPSDLGQASLPTHEDLSAPRRAQAGNRFFHPPELYGIYRAKTTGRISSAGNSWTWRVMISRDKKWVCNKSFADVRYGGEQQALDAAIVYRNDILKRVPPVPSLTRNQRLRRNNTSGVAGVCRDYHRGYAFYLAQTMLPDGTRLRRSFGIAKYGEERARELAVTERLRQLALVESHLAAHSLALAAEPARPGPTAADDGHPCADTALAAAAE